VSENDLLRLLKLGLGSALADARQPAARSFTRSGAVADGHAGAGETLAEIL